MTTLTNEQQAAEWTAQLAETTAATTLQWAAGTFGGQVALASSLGVEDQVLTDLITHYALPLPVFTLDTGRLFSETNDLLRLTEQRYGLKISIYVPDGAEVERMVNEHGIDAYRNSIELRKECCRVRKVQPLRRALTGLKAWVCGLRREQSVTRQKMAPVEWDAAFGLFKISPLVAWSEDQVWAYVRKHKVPYHPFHDRSFPSIGCACCTRAVAPGEDVRSGRWWWENPEHKECGLHSRPVLQGS